jgi:hypothetical protein
MQKFSDILDPFIPVLPIGPQLSFSYLFPISLGTSKILSRSTQKQFNLPTLAICILIKNAFTTSSSPVAKKKWPELIF